MEDGKAEIKASEIVHCDYNAFNDRGIGMFHCPKCGSMILGGEEQHWVDPVLICERVAEALRQARKEAFLEAAEIVENGCFCTSEKKTCELTEAAQAIRTAGEREI